MTDTATADTLARVVSLLDEDEDALEMVLGLMHTYAGSDWEGQDGVFPPDREALRVALNALLPYEEEEG